MILSSLRKMKICCYCILGPCWCPERYHWLPPSITHGNLRGLSPIVAHPKNNLIISWGWWVSGTHQIPSNMWMVYHNILTHPMTAPIHKLLPYFTGFFITYTSWEPLHALILPLCTLLIYCHHPTLSIYFEQWHACTSVMDKNLVLVGYRLPQLHHYVHHDFIIIIVWCIWNIFRDGTFQWNWYTLWYFRCLPISSW